TAGETADGINGWTVSNDPFRFPVTSQHASAGDQSLEMTGGSPGRTISFQRVTTNTETAQYLQYAIRPTGENGGGSNYRHVLYLFGIYEGGATQRPSEIWLYSNHALGANRINVLDYEND